MATYEELLQKYQPRRSVVGNIGELLKTIGHGAQGKPYESPDIALQRELAIKDLQAQQKAESDAAAAELEHKRKLDEIRTTAETLQGAFMPRAPLNQPSGVTAPSAPTRLQSLNIDDFSPSEPMRSAPSSPNVPQQGYGIYESMWQQIPEEERQFYSPEPDIKMIQGIPVITGYKPTLTESGKVKLKQMSDKATADLKASQESETAQRMASQNVATVAGAMRRLSETLRDAIKEGGAGGIVPSTISSVAGRIGGRVGAQFPASAALPGQVTEVIARMMPLLTQQGDKPGSVRLVSTVFDRLLQTVPNKVSSPEEGLRMMTETIRNMYGYANAIKKMGITNEQVDNLSDEQLSQLGNAISSYANSIVLTPQEKAEEQELLRVALEPLQSVVGRRDESTISELNDKWGFLQ